MLKALLLALLLALPAFAHVRMTAISVNGGAFVSDSVRLPPSNSPVTDVTSVSSSKTYYGPSVLNYSTRIERYCRSIYPPYLIYC